MHRIVDPQQPFCAEWVAIAEFYSKPITALTISKIRYGIRYPEPGILVWITQKIRDADRVVGVLEDFKVWGEVINALAVVDN